MTTRLKKYTREKDKAPAIVLQDRDLKILDLVHDFRFLRSDQIAALVRENGVDLKSNRAILRRLQKLFHNGLVDRPRDQIRYDMQGSDRMIYALGNGGADLLAETFGLDRGKIDWRKKNREVKRNYLQHALMISQFRTVLTIALRDQSNVKLLFWRQGDEIRDQVEIENQRGNKVRYPVCSDGFFGLKNSNRENYYFLEADRSTMTNKRFFRKIRGYWAYYKTSGHTKKYGIRNLRVLTITLTESRKENLRKAAKKADKRKQGSGMFMFSCEKSYSLDEPQRILDSIWQTPSGEPWQSLLD